MKFIGGDGQGLDHYMLTFDKGVVRPRTILTADGKADMPSTWAAMPPGSRPDHAGATSPLPGTEDAVRKFFTALENGTQNYDDMAVPGLAAVAHTNEAANIQMVKDLGALKSQITFLRADAGGADVFRAEFANSPVQISDRP